MPAEKLGNVIALRPSLYFFSIQMNRIETTCSAVSGVLFKISPVTGDPLFRVARSGKADVHVAVESAKRPNRLGTGNSCLSGGHFARGGDDPSRPGR